MTKTEGLGHSGYAGWNVSELILKKFDTWSSIGTINKLLEMLVDY